MALAMNLGPLDSLGDHCKAAIFVWWLEATKVAVAIIIRHGQIHCLLAFDRLLTDSRPTSTDTA
jgi:hypothetical protein